MYRKFLFHHQPERSPWHPDYEVEYLGVYSSDCEFNIEIEELYINGQPMPVRQDLKPGCQPSQDWQRFIQFLKYNVISCDSDERQAGILLPVDSAFAHLNDRKFGAAPSESADAQKPQSNAKQVDPADLVWVNDIQLS